MRGGGITGGKVKNLDGIVRDSGELSRQMLDIDCRVSTPGRSRVPHRGLAVRTPNTGGAENGASNSYPPPAPVRVMFGF